MTSTTHMYTHTAAPFPEATPFSGCLCHGPLCIQKVTKRCERVGSAELALGVLPPGNAFSLSRAGQGPACLPAAPG